MFYLPINTSIFYYPSYHVSMSIIIRLCQNHLLPTYRNDAPLFLNTPFCINSRNPWPSYSPPHQLISIDTLLLSQCTVLNSDFTICPNNFYSLSRIPSGDMFLWVVRSVQSHQSGIILSFSCYKEYRPFVLWDDNQSKSLQSFVLKMVSCSWYGKNTSSLEMVTMVTWLYWCLPDLYTIELPFFSLKLIFSRKL